LEVQEFRFSLGAATVRLNTGAGYYGCLRIEVLRCGELYKRIEGWCDAVLASAKP
jgi:hypothetical protein